MPSANDPLTASSNGRLGKTLLFVLPSTSPANAAVSWDERLEWFRSLRTPASEPLASSGS